MSPSFACTPMMTSVGVPLAAASIASAPAIRSCSLSVIQPLASCGHTTPGTLALVQNATCPASRGRSSLLSGVQGVWAIG